MRVVFFGTSAFGIPALEALRRSNHEIIAVVSTPDTRKGRDLKLQPSTVKEWALHQNLRTLEYDRSDLDSTVRRLKDFHADVFVVISFGVILPQAVLDLAGVASLNVHSSLLPLYRGPAPMHWAILNGDDETGVTVMRMVPKLDAGDILVQVKMPIAENDDLKTIEASLAAMGAEALVSALDAIASNRASYTPQDESKATYARKITKEDGRLDWKLEPKQVVGRVRGLAGWPGTYTFYEGKRLIVLGAKPGPASPAAPGTIVGSTPEGVRVALSGGSVVLTALQLEGKKPLPAADFVRGFPLREGAVLE